MSSRDLRILLVLVGIAFVGLTAWSLRYFSGYQPLTALTKNYAQAGLGQIGLQAEGVLVVGHDRGRRRWQMAARCVTFSRDRRSLSIGGIRQGLLYDKSGKTLVSVTAGHASYQTVFGTVGASATGTLRLDSGIRAVVLTPQQPILQSQALVWDVLRSELSCPAAVTVTLPRLSVTAGNALYALPTGAKFMASQGTLSLGGGVHAVLHNLRGLTTLNCPGLTWNGSLNRARSLGPVSVQIPGGLGLATAADIQADTKTGNLTGHGFGGTLRLSTEVQ